MKKTSWKHLVRTIRKNAVSFFAVAFIAAISIAIYIGLQSAATATLAGADQYFAENRLANFEGYGKEGISVEDLARFEQAEGISLAVGGYHTQISVKQDREVILVNALSLTENINLPVVLEGELPRLEHQVAIEEKFAKEKGVSVGDSISFPDRGLLKTADFTVSAVINRPEYCCANVKDVRGMGSIGLGAMSYYMCFSEEAFQTELLGGRYTKAYFKADALEGYDTYSREYREQEEKILQHLKSAVDDRKQYTFATRNDMGDLRGMKILVDSIFGLSYIMSLIFVLVAVIVCYAAVSRMIYEQRSLIGAQKALGFRFGEILRHYTLYNLSSALLGIVLGILIGVFIVELIVIRIFSGEFLLPGIPVIFPAVPVVIASAVCIAIFLVTSFAASLKLLKQPATVLLKHEIKSRKKPFFFERFRRYQKLRLYTRSMIKNVLNDKERMVTTVMGVVGCISLLIICFGLKMGIENSSVKQFEDYFLYENRLAIDSTKANPEEYGAVLEENQIRYLAVSDKLRGFYVEESTPDSGHIVVTDDFERLQDFMLAQDAFTGENLPLPGEGVYVSRKCAETYGLAQGDTVMLASSAGDYKECKISGVMEHFLPYHLFLMTSDYYETVMSEPADRCVYLLKGDVSALSEKVTGLDGFLWLKDNSDSAARADQVNMVIGLCIALAAILSVLVLLNQITMHISRKSKELAVMRVNGYSLRETKLYVCKDNIVLTLAGLVLGCVFGSAISVFSILILEGEMNRYVRAADPLACLIGVGIGIVFAVAVNLIALRKIDKLELTSIQKD